MSGSDLKRPVSTGERAYGMLLRLYPRTFRNEYGRELCRLVQDRLRDDQPAGPGGVAFFWIGMFADLARTAFLERWEHTVNTDNLTRYGGPLAILGGLLWTGALAAVAANAGDSSQWVKFEDVIVILLVAAIAITGATATLIANDAVVSPGMAIAGTLFNALGALLFFGGILTGAWYVGSGAIYALFVGSLLIGLGMLARQGVPRWSAWFLIIASLAIFPLNVDNWQAWLGVPLGLAWAAAGYTLWVRASDRIMPAT